MNLKKILLFLCINCLINVNASNLKKDVDYIDNTLQILQNTTPEKEFILGKKLITQSITDEMYPFDSPRVKYVNKIINSLILSSNRPYIFDGYKVILVKNNSFNAHAYPGGIIVLNDGVFKNLSNEDQLAAILAHEIGHIQEKHNLTADKSYKVEDAMEIASVLGLSKHVDNGYAQTISYSVVKGFSKKIVDGYGVDQEAEADELGLTLLSKAGYDPIEFINTLKKLKEITNSYGGANYPNDRLSRLEKLVEKLDYDKKKVLESKFLRTKRYQNYD